jgi:glutamate synthase domain-containing protein 2/glutamate synthase domain-containing protein 1/glutamate synthase domain-containing protein 3
MPLNRSVQKNSRTNPGLYDPTATKSNCGVGVVMHLGGEKSHALVEDGFQILENLDHRGARGAEEKTGDGAGMLLQKPHEFFKAALPQLGDFDSYGVGQLFLPRDEALQTSLVQLVNDVTQREGFAIIAWRDVPTDNSDLGKTALQYEPVVKQVFVQPAQPLEPEKLDTKLYVLRRLIEKAAQEVCDADHTVFYICSLDRRKIVYKGLLTCKQMKLYYPELSDEHVKTSLALVHSRFSTNTLGAWELAHPFRAVVHNGEINTLRGNINRMKTREAALACPRIGEDIERIKPVVAEGQSDTAAFDSVLELLLEAGRSLPHALRMMIPEAWSKDPLMDEERKAFYDYHSTLIEPWDGPALVAASDGYSVGAVLDRNGLRPCRYCVTRDNKLIMASEAGVLQTPPHEIILKGRLKPGQMFLADTRKGRIIPEAEIFQSLQSENYSEWLDEKRLRLTDLIDGQTELQQIPPDKTTRYQQAFGYTMEYLERLLEPMATMGKDPIGAMGNDAPPAVLSQKHKPLFNYFSQLFAQVSNPPIDYLREDLVTSLESHVGQQHNLLAESIEHCRQIFLKSPILTDGEFAALQSLDENAIRSTTLDITYPKEIRMSVAIETIRSKAVAAIEDGTEILILSDQLTGPERVAIPVLLALGAVHHHLIRTGLRTRAGIVLDTGQPCTVHHFCALIGYGADAIHPWLAYASTRRLIVDRCLSEEPHEAITKYRKAIEDGLLKVMAKMGVSTLESYKGAQLFETVGLDEEFVNEYFERTTSHISGVGLEQIEKETLQLHELAFGEHISNNLRLDAGGELYWRRDGEVHGWNPFTIAALQRAARLNDGAAYKEFAQLINDQDEKLLALRGLLDFQIDKSQSIPLEEVEPREVILKRFGTGSMSFGSLSKEAHECLATAMNRIGGKAGSGEGGEEVERFGTERECSMKQVASGRFGVTAHYLASAKQIEIKMAQGAKPGEGGELPGNKVDEVIAKVRFTTPGVGLISPPPHHDIYSIEDLAQLIHDLKCANPDAEVHVKLVAVANVGTIAAGVAKARADAVLISGNSGGTGASVKTSIKNAGSLWELGLAETHQTLLATNLRSRITVRVDGGLMTGRDVAIAALLGAEEYGFGTAPLVAVGCIMLRKCHCNTCSVGVATQDPQLRKKFPGTPEHVINYMNFIADETREIMASLGFRTLDEMIGRADKLMPKAVKLKKAQQLDLSKLLYMQPSEDDRRKTRAQNHKLETQLDHQLIAKARPALDESTPVCIEIPIRNRDRTVGTMLSSLVTKKHGEKGLPADTIRVHLSGSAGQSLGAFLAPGISLRLEGEANDYVGKGLSGGKITVSTPPDAAYKAGENIIIGNVALYGATSGELYVNGEAGERFAVRNSGAMAVVEGIGDHGCEYMTGGVVVVLGECGKNFGAGMSGGEAYFFGEDPDFETKLNTGMVSIEKFTDARDHGLVQRMLENHCFYTHSSKAKRILDDWETSKSKLVKVISPAYVKVIEQSFAESKDIRPSLPPSPTYETAAPKELP